MFRDNSGRRLAAIASLWAFCALLQANPAHASDLAVLTNAQQIRDLSASEAARNYPVKLHAVVNYIDSTIGELFVQDRTNGVFIFINESKASEPLTPGQTIEVEGVTTPGDFAPAITRASIRVVGKTALPTPMQLPFDEYSAGQHECQRLEVDGVVQSGQVKQGRLQMHVHTIGGSLVATMVDYPANWADMLVRSKVRLRGVIAAIFNQHRQAVGVRMFIPGGQIQVLQPGPANPFALPLSPFSSVGQLHSLQELPKAIRVRATVSAIQPGIGMYISDGSLSMEAQDANQCAAQPGDLVDFVGFPGLLEGRPALENSICRKAGADASVPPQMVSADQILPLPRVEDASGYGYSVDSRYDMQVVRMEGKLLETSNSQDGEIWMLTSGKTSFDALIPPGQFENGQQLQSGTHLRLTGVCIVSFDQFGRGQSFRLLLRTPADVVVLGRPPWWSLRHAAWILAIGLVSFLAAILWISVLRRQVEQKTEQIRKTNEILQELSEQDGLTGIANRRRFDMKLNAEWSRARRSGSPLSLLLIDIDAFKALNDEYGHLRGDECLVTVARTMNSMALRSVDLVARYGGEEFAVILPGTDLPGAMEVGERLRATIQALGVPHNGSRFGQVLTISVGVATTGPGSRTACSGLVELADRALYRSKTRGRNRVTSSEEVPHPSEADTPDLQGYAEPRA